MWNKHMLVERNFFLCVHFLFLFLQIALVLFKWHIYASIFLLFITCTCLTQPVSLFFCFLSGGNVQVCRSAPPELSQHLIKEDMNSWVNSTEFLSALRFLGFLRQKRVSVLIFNLNHYREKMHKSIFQESGGVGCATHHFRVRLTSWVTDKPSSVVGLLVVWGHRMDLRRHTGGWARRCFCLWVMWAYTTLMTVISSCRIWRFVFACWNKTVKVREEVVLCAYWLSGSAQHALEKLFKIGTTITPINKTICKHCLYFQTQTFSQTVNLLIVFKFSTVYILFHIFIFFLTLFLVLSLLSLSLSWVNSGSKELILCCCKEARQ